MISSLIPKLQLLLFFNYAPDIKIGNIYQWKDIDRSEIDSCIWTINVPQAKEKKKEKKKAILRRKDRPLNFSFHLVYVLRPCNQGDVPFGFCWLKMLVVRLASGQLAGARVMKWQAAFLCPTIPVLSGVSLKNEFQSIRELCHFYLHCWKISSSGKIQSQYCLLVTVL